MGLGLIGGKEDLPVAADLGQMPAKPHHRKVLHSDRPIGEQSDHEGVPKLNGPTPRRPSGSSFGFLHQALAQRCELVDRLQARGLVTYRTDPRPQVPVDLDEPPPVRVGRHHAHGVIELLNAT